MDCWGRPQTCWQLAGNSTQFSPTSNPGCPKTFVQLSGSEVLPLDIWRSALFSQLSFPNLAALSGCSLRPPQWCNPVFIRNIVKGQYYFPRSPHPGFCFLTSRLLSCCASGTWSWSQLTSPARPEPQRLDNWREKSQDQLLSIDFKTVFITFTALHGLAPSYILDLLKPDDPGRCLSSSASPLLASPTARWSQKATRHLLLNIIWAKAGRIFESPLKTHFYRKSFLE